MHNKFFFHAYTTDTIFQFFSVTNIQQYFTKIHQPNPSPPQKKPLTLENSFTLAFELVLFISDSHCIG